MANFLTLLSIGLVAFIGYKLLFQKKKVPKGICLPPGPPRNPIIGNLLDMPRRNGWETLDQWAKEYGEIVYIELLGMPVVCINSKRLAHELFEKRSSLYSDRVDATMTMELMGFNWAFAFHRYGDWWRRHRRAMHEKMHLSAVNEYKPLQLRNTRKLLYRLLRDPQNYGDHLRHWIGALVMELAYGIQVQAENDPYLRVAEAAARAGSEAAVPGAFLVDMLPWLKYLPEWVPGASFKKKARLWKKDVVASTVLPFQAAKKEIAAGMAKESFTSTHLQALEDRQDSPPDEEEIIMNTAAMIYVAGSDTTVGMLKTFILAMVLYPDVQKKAQAELDAVIGSDRLVEFEDKDTLPYVHALCKETLRWQPLLPFGIPHAVTENDVVDGYFIPKGTIVLGNVWGLLRNEADFGENTDKFIPERFLQSELSDPAKMGAFGFGRRICPGRYMAENALFITIASILQTFHISGAKDCLDGDVAVESEWTSGLLCCAFDPISGEDIKCMLKPRSQAAEELIRAATDIEKA